LHRMTGWLHANDIGIVMWKLHRLPGGWWLGTMMVITSILSVTSDLLVTRLINPTLQPGFCPFDQGLVVEVSLTKFFKLCILICWPPNFTSRALHVSKKCLNQSLWSIYTP
jgi:hypothetical protein